MKRPTRNALFLLIGEMSARLFGFLVAAFLARRLGIAGFGQIGFAMSIMAYGVVVTKFGLLTVGIRESAQERNAVPRLTGNVLSLRLILSAVAVAGMLVFAVLVNKEPSVKWLLVLFALGVVVQTLLLEWVFTGIERMEHITIARIATSFCYFGLVAALVKGPAGILYVPIALAGATLLGTIVLLVPYMRTFGWPRLRLDRPVCAFLIRSAWPIGIASVVTQFHVNFAIVGLALIRTDYEAGLYTAAHRLVFFLLMLDRVFQAVFLPVISRYVKSNINRLAELTGTALRVILAIGLPFCFGVLLLAQPVVRFVFGPDYAQSAPILQVLVWFFLLSLLSSLAGFTLLASRQERRFARNTGIGVAVSLVLIGTGIVLLGGRGGAAGMVLGEACILGLMAYDFLRMVRPRIGRRIVIPLLACIPMVIIMVLVRDWNWPMAALAGGGAYLAVLFLGKGLTLDDLGLIKRHDWPAGR